MPSIQFEHFVRNLETSLGAPNSEDLIYVWLEIGLTNILSLPWSWNEKTEQQLMLRQITETELFTWVAGNNYITFANPLVDLSWEHTGRKVKVGDEWYRVLDIGVTTPNRIRLDGHVLTTEADGAELTFVRTTYTARTNRLLRLETSDQGRIYRFNRHKRASRYARPGVLSSSSPVYYEDDINYRIPAPKNPPTVPSTNVGLSVLPPGRYYYYYVHYDSESGLESLPGPNLVYDADGVNNPEIIYGSTDGADTNTTYGLRLYRSEKDPQREHTPMFRIDQRGPEASPSPHEDFVSSPMYDSEPRWTSNYVNYELIPPPEDTFRLIRVTSIRQLGFAPRPTSYFDLGDSSDVYDLLVTYLQGRLSASSRDAVSDQSSQAAFNKQLRFLLSRDRDKSDHESDVDADTNYYPGKGLIDGQIGSDVDGVLGRLTWRDT